MNTGISGVIAAETAIATITGERLTYRGYDVTELAARSTFPMVASILWTGEIPLPADLAANEAAMIAARDAALGRAYRDGAPPQDDLMPALLATYAAWAREHAFPAGTIPRAAATVGVLPALVARLVHGRDLRPPRSVSFAGGVLELLRAVPPKPAEARAMDVLLITYAEHELNASTFAARVVASTMTEMESAVLAALAALQGPLHGGSYRAIRALLEQVVAGATPEDVLRPLGEKVPGFGHAVYKSGDPRAAILRQAALGISGGAAPAWLAAADTVAETVRAAHGLQPNVDFYAVALYRALGIPPRAATALFAISRSAGWTAHILEQQADNRLMRPRARYVGRPPRPYPTE